MKKLRLALLIFLTFLKRYFKKLSGNIFVFLKFKYFVVLIFIIFSLFILIKYFIPYFNQTTISEGFIGVYTNNNLPPTITNLLSESLVEIDEKGIPKPKLAEKWDTNKEFNTYTFKLKDNLFWNDGSKIQSSDIKFNLPDLNVKYPDSTSIEFKLVDSFSPFPTFLINPIFKDKTLVGVGKYILDSEEITKGFISKMILKPKDKNQNLPVIIIRFYPDEKTAKTAFDLGEVDSLIGVSEITSYKSNPNNILKQIQVFNKILAIFYNTKDNILSDKNFRRALSFSAPEIKGEERAKTSFPSSSWAFNETVKDYLGNIETAKSYFDKVEKGKNDTLILTTTPTFSTLGETIVKSWKELGVNAVLRIESGVPQNFQALLIQQSIPLDPDQYTLWHSTQSNTNISNYSSPRIDKDLEDGRKTGDIEIRKEKYADFQRVLLDDAPATFLYFPKYNVIYRKKIENNINTVLSIQIPQIKMNLN